MVQSMTILGKCSANRAVYFERTSQARRAKQRMPSAQVFGLRALTRAAAALSRRRPRSIRKEKILFTLLAQKAIELGISTKE